MDKPKIEEVVFSLNNMSYLDKQEVFNRVFSLGKFSTIDLNEKLVLVSLVALVTQQMRSKQPELTPLQVLLKLTGQIKDNSGYYQFLEGLACLVEDALFGCSKIDPCGCKTSAEIINKIKEILSTWLPF